MIQAQVYPGLPGVAAALAVDRVRGRSRVAAMACHGRKGTLGALGAILLVMVIHSLNDSSAGLGCDDAEVSFWAQIFRWALVIAVYLIFRAGARASTPPPLIGSVNRGWTPHHLRTYTRERAFVGE